VPRTHPGLRVEVDHDRRVHYAMQQNDVPVVHEIRVRNETERARSDLALHVWIDAGFTEPVTLRIDRLGPRATHRFETPDLTLDPTILKRQTEREATLLRVELEEDGQIVLERALPIEVLASNEWGGIVSLPEMLAAFVLPNHPRLARILAAARAPLAEAGGTLDAYASGDPGNVRRIVAACYTAVRSLDLAYVNPPASFEVNGQKVRTPDQILEHGMGTCLDLVLLFASILEQAGLHPILVLVEGHAFVAVWLRDESFPEPAFDDPARLRKRIDLGEILALEATSVTARVPVDFDTACQEARRGLERSEAFLCAIDVRAARRTSIRPLPYRSRDEELPLAGSELPSREDESDVPVPPSDPTASGDGRSAPAAREDTATAAPPDRGAPRLDRWKRKLLDLSLRNRLLNFRPTRRTITLLAPDLARLEDALSEGQEFSIHPRPDFMDEDGPRSAALHRERTAEDPVARYVVEEFRDRRLHATHDREDLDHRLLELYRAARTDLEETGTNSLHLALGFLRWYETPQSDTPRLAPILLLPIELARRSVSEGYRLRLADEEPHLNVTLLEKLGAEFRVDVSGLDDLPEDAAGLDVPEILRRFRVAVKELPRFDVVEDAVAGLYAFTKFLMWADLERRADEILGAPVVAHLVERPGEAFPNEGTFPDPETLDDEVPPQDALCPLDADSSQLAAVLAGVSRTSFVLQGPPGTGKSQTITNLIASALGRGLRVLFVAEKMAALDVVHRRLESVGLAPFCLELHSNKTSKRRVLEQIGAAMEVARASAPGDWAERAEELAALRDELNGYVREMHAERPLGISLFDATARLATLRHDKRIRLDREDLASLDAARFRAMAEGTNRIAEAVRVLGVEPASHPLRGVGRGDWTSTLAASADNALAELDEAAAALGERVRELALELRLPEETAPSEDDLDRLASLAGLLLEFPAIREPLVSEPGWDELAERLEGWIRRAEERERLRETLCNRYEPDLLRIDLDATLRALRAARTRIAPLRWWGVLRIRRSLRGVALDGRVPAADELQRDLETALRLREENRVLDDPGAEPVRYFGPVWDRGNADPARLRAKIDWAGRFRRALLDLRGALDPGTAGAVRRRAISLAVEDRDALAKDAPVGRGLRAFTDSCTHYEAKRAAAGGLLEIDAREAFGASDAPDHLARARERAREMRGALGTLRDWCFYRRVRAGALAAGLEPLVRALEHGELETAHLGRTLERSVLEPWWSARVDASERLRRFHRVEHERAIERFRELDRAWLERTREWLRAELASRVPPIRQGGSPNSEAGILKRQLKLRRRHLPVRKLVSRLPNLLPLLKPCFLMSPLSVAKYLDPEFPPFDLVIFDEASQIPVWDAIGSLGRGSCAVIVGDSKQLPPTNFFLKLEQEGDLDFEDEIEEVESILDECEAGGLPTRRLEWHYRSRHESLIAFSNAHYYGGGLLTFPGPEERADGLGVSLRFFAEGVYDKGRTRTNHVEAEAIVEEIVARLTRAADGDPDAAETIGVVAFSQAQQTRIEDLLEEARRREPRIEPFFSTDRLEPVFVKNLENVQGDERDVILFSIGYGPDERGRVSMGFGPLNREGGERRLNVAITRARRQVVVFSSIRADDVDLSRTRAVGVAHLKSFLDYAEHGARGASERTASFEPSDLVTSVRDALAERGHRVECGVGCSGYRIDLAVRDPDEPDRFLLGIECDGEAYRSADTARDRDRLRAQVLAGLGWRLRRLWSGDWWSDPARELVRLEQAIEDARRPAEAPGATDAAIASGTGDGSENDGPGEGEPLWIARRAPAAGGAPSATRIAPGDPLGDTSDGGDPAASGPQTYPRPLAIEPLGDAELFYAPSVSTPIAKRLAAVVRHEAPVEVSRACRDVAAAFGVERLTQRARARVQDALGALRPDARPREIDGFFWRPDQELARYASFRVPDPDDPSPRRAEEIPPIEIANAARWILASDVSLPAEDLEREVARLFGIRRLGSNVREAMAAGIALLEARGGARRDGDRIVLPQDGPAP